MSMDFICFGWILLLMKPLAVVLSVCIGVGGCGCPISFSMFLMWADSLALTKRDPTSASAADDTAALIICDILRMAPLLDGMSSLLDKKKCPLALLLVPSFL